MWLSGHAVVKPQGSSGRSVLSVCSPMGPAFRHRRYGASFARALECPRFPSSSSLWSRVFLCFWFSRNAGLCGQALGLSSCVSAPPVAGATTRVLPGVQCPLCDCPLDRSDLWTRACLISGLRKPGCCAHSCACLLVDRVLLLVECKPKVELLEPYTWLDFKDTVRIFPSAFYYS